MLIGNYSLLTKTPGRYLSGGVSTVRSNWQGNGAFANSRLPDGEVSAQILSARPSGYSTGWMMPQIAGAMSSHYDARGSTTLSVSMAAGINVNGISVGYTDAFAVAQLIVSAVGTALGSTFLSGDIVASLAASGVAVGTTSVDGAIGAVAWAKGESLGSSSAALRSYAVGTLKGSISPFTELSPENLAAAVWDSLLSNHQQSGSMGEAITAAGGGMTPASIWQYLVDGSFSAEELMRIMASALLGKASGANSSEMRFRDLADTKDRIVATVDQYGNRAAVTLDAD